MPAPMPGDAPVTTATLPASLPMGCSFQTGEGRTQGWMLREFGRFELLDDSARKGLDSGCMRPLFHPSIEEITVEAILHALADPVRVALYAEIVASACPRSCSSLMRSEEHTSELQSQSNLVCRLLLEKKKTAAVKLPVHTITYI